MSKRDILKFAAGTALACLVGMLAGIAVTDRNQQQRITALESRLENLGTGLADLATRQTTAELNATDTLAAAQSVQADLGALRKAILAAMTTNITVQQDATGGYVPRWTTTNVLATATNRDARPLPPGTPRVVQP